MLSRNFIHMFSFSLLVLKISFAIYVHALHESLPIGAFLSNIFRVSCRAASYIADYTHTGTPKNECPTLYNMSILSPPTPQYLSVSWFCKGLLQNQYRSPNDEAIEGSDKTNTSGLRGKRWWCTQSDWGGFLNSDHRIDFPALIALYYFTDFPWQVVCQAQTAFIISLLMIAKLSLYSLQKLYWWIKYYKDLLLQNQGHSHPLS